MSSEAVTSVYQFVQTFSIYAGNCVETCASLFLPPGAAEQCSASPVRTDAEARLSCRSDPVARLPSVHDDEDRLHTTGCCFVRSRDAARLTSASPGVTLCGTTAVYVSSVVSSDAISTARLLGDSAGQGTCSLTEGPPKHRSNWTCSLTEGPPKHRSNWTCSLTQGPPRHRSNWTFSLTQGPPKHRSNWTCSLTEGPPRHRSNWTCSLTAAAAVNAACEPLLCPPSRSPRLPSESDDDNATKGDCVATARRPRDSGIAFIDEDDRL